MAAGAPSFSYAQAAKGESSQNSSTAASTAASSTGAAESTTAEMRRSTTELERDINAPNGETNHEFEVNKATPSSSIKPVVPQTVTKSDQAPKMDTEASKPELVEAVQAPTIITPSAGPNGLGKDDMGAATPNESDSAWEKVSQASQTETKEESKPESDDSDTKLSSWEHVPPANQLKEAPLPAFNVWHKRAADAKTKGYDPKPSPTGLTSSNSEGSAAPAFKKTTDLPADSMKKKGTPVRQNADEQVSSSASRGNGPVAGSSTAAPKNSPIPPPPTDAVSWPTPETAKEEDKKKTTDKAEKPDGEKTPSKSHGKEKWVQMPYVPTAVFNTPLPTNRRGGRAGTRGGRDGAGRGSGTNGANGGDRSQGNGGGAGAPGAPPLNGGRGDMGPPRPGPLPSKGKRASSAGPATSAEAHKPGDGSGLKSPHNQPNAADGRRVSSSQQIGSRQWSPGSRTPAGEGELGTRPQSNPQDNSHSRNPSERRNDTSRMISDANGYGPPRERGDGRPDRGRGGYRGRGNLSNATGTHHMAGQAYPPGSNPVGGYPPAKSQSYSDPRRESVPTSSTFPSSREPRHARTNSRSQSIPTSNFGRFPGPPHLPQLQTDAANMYYPQHPGVMSAVPYPGYMEHVQLSGLVQMQMEYYFSVDNLCKDMFLRKHMDSQGFVFLDVLQNFNRIKQLTQDLELIRFVCSRSTVIELLRGGDGIDRLRRGGDWLQWVMPKEERDPSARNDGPSSLHVPQPPFMFPYGDPNMMPMTNGPMTPKTAHPGSHFRPEPLALNDGHHSTGQTTESPATTTPVTDTPLSAAVPDFQPSMQMAPNPPIQYSASSVKNTFPDSELAGLNVVYSKAPNSQSQRKSPTPGAQEFPNGSTSHGSTGNENHTQATIGQMVNGSPHGEASTDSGRPGSTLKVEGPDTNDSAIPSEALLPSIFWMRSQDDPVENLPPFWTREAYTTLRQKALSARGQPTENILGVVKILYQFWSHFLLKNFNQGMYEDFRRLAMEDLQVSDDMTGMVHLVGYYHHLLLGHQQLSDTVARDYADLLKEERARSHRPAFESLRAVWNTDFLPESNRLLVEKFVDPDLKKELDIRNSSPTAPTASP